MTGKTPPVPKAYVTWTNNTTGAQQVRFGTHEFQFGDEGDGYCYGHQSFDCLDNLNEAERKALSHEGDGTEPAPEQPISSADEEQLRQMLEAQERLYEAVQQYAHALITKRSLAELIPAASAEDTYRAATLHRSSQAAAYASVDDWAEQVSRCVERGLNLFKGR